MLTPEQLTLRDYFAGQALVALITTAGQAESTADLSLDGESSLVATARFAGWGADVPNIADEDGNPISYAEYLADEAYCLATAMVRERGKPSGAKEALSHAD